MESGGLARLEVGVRKCATLGVAAYKKKKTWAQDTNPFTIGGQPVKTLAPGEFYKNLCVQMGVCRGGTAHKLYQDLSARIDRMLKA